MVKRRTWPGTAVMAWIGLALAVPTAAQEGAQEWAMREVTGALTSAERVALPPEARVIVEVRGAGDEVLAESRSATEGRQPPLPFRLAMPQGVAGTVRGGVFDGGRPLWVSDPVAVPAGDAAVELGEIRLVPFEPMGFASRLRCGDRELTVGFVDDHAVLEVGGARRELRSVRSASGAKFEAPDDPGTFFWSKGETAQVSLDGELLPECVLVVPQARTPFRGGGNEPGWHVTVREGRIALVTDYGGERRETAAPAPDFAPGTVVYEVAEWDARVRIEHMLCRDTMTGMPHPKTVTVTLPNRTLDGCGGEPSSLLTGPAWVVEDIAGGGVIDASRVTLDFRPDGSLAGRASCNRYTARFELTGENLTVSPAASTRMACAPALMEQEQRFFEALERVFRFDLDDTGALVLIGVDGRTALLARRG